MYNHKSQEQYTDIVETSPTSLHSSPESGIRHEPHTQASGMNPTLFLLGDYILDIVANLFQTK